MWAHFWKPDEKSVSHSEPKMHRRSRPGKHPVNPEVSFFHLIMECALNRPLFPIRRHSRHLIRSLLLDNDTHAGSGNHQFRLLHLKGEEHLCAEPTWHTNDMITKKILCATKSRHRVRLTAPLLGLLSSFQTWRVGPIK